MFFFFSTEYELQWIILLGDIRKRDKTKPKVETVDNKKQTRAEDNFIRHQLMGQKVDYSKHYCITKPVLWKKMWQHPMWGKDFVKQAYMAELLSRNCCWGRKTMSKRSSESRHWTIEWWHKVLWTDENKFEIFGSNRRVWWRVGERAATPCITPTLKHGRGIVMVWVANWIRPAIMPSEMWLAR